MAADRQQLSDDLTLATGSVRVRVCGNKARSFASGTYGVSSRRDSLVTPMLEALRCGNSC